MQSSASVYRSRGWFAAGIGCACFALAQAATAQGPTKSYRIGVLGQGNPRTNEIPGADFQQGLRDLGYVDGKNVVVEFRYAGGSVDKLPDLANEFVAPESRRHRHLRRTGGVRGQARDQRDPHRGDRVRVGSRQGRSGGSLNRPGGNVTGLSSISEELWQKRLALLREIVPRLSRVTVLWNPAIRVTARAWTKSGRRRRRWACSFKHSRWAMAVRWSGPSPRSRKPPRRAGDVLGQRDAGVRQAIADFAMKRRLPTLAPLHEYVKAGRSPVVRHEPPGASAACRVLRGQDLQGREARRTFRRTPTHFELVVNLATAKVVR